MGRCQVRVVVVGPLVVDLDLVDVANQVEAGRHPDCSRPQAHLREGERQGRGVGGRAYRRDLQAFGVEGVAVGDAVVAEVAGAVDQDGDGGEDQQGGRKPGGGVLGAEAWSWPRAPYLAESATREAAR